MQKHTGNSTLKGRETGSNGYFSERDLKDKDSVIFSAVSPDPGTVNKRFRAQ